MESEPYRASRLDEGSWSVLGGSVSQDSQEGEVSRFDDERFASRQAYGDYFGLDEGQQESLFSRSVQTGEKMFGKSQDEADSKDSKIDTRKFLKESHSLMLGALSVEKPLLSNFGVKTSLASRDEPIALS